MRIRLAMVACQGPAEGPWIRARGNETGICVRGLAKGERIISRLDILGVIQPLVVLERDGTWPLPDVWTRIQFVKQCLDSTLSITHVELLVA